MTVLAGIASIPEREHSLQQTVASLAHQADRVHVALNGYKEPPAFLSDHANVTCDVLNGNNGGDAEKFSAVDDWDGTVVTCDDDLVYPPDYVEALTAGLDRHDGRMVGFHGGTTLGWNGSAKAASHKSIRCLGALENDDTDVNVLGTGALAYDTRKVPLWRGVFRNRNMADVHLACHARSFGIPMAALAHQAGWLQTCHEGPGIYESNRDQDGSDRDTTEQRKAELERFNWKLPVSRPSVRVSIATCQRPHLLPDLLLDLEREAQWVDLHVCVFEDPSTADYSKAHDIVWRNGWEWHRFTRKLGKAKHWELVNLELKSCRDSQADWFVFLPDDIRLKRHAIPRAIDNWHLLEDPIALTLWRLKDHENQTNWTGRLPVKQDHAWEVFHVDGIYLCRSPLLEFFKYEIPRQQPRTGMFSSGVGRTMSLRLNTAHKRMYRVDTSLAIPVHGAASVMNPDATDRPYQWIAL